jgi:hypothetical protein
MSPFFKKSKAPDEMTFKLVGNGGNCDGCEWIAAEGVISENTPKIFQKYIESNFGEKPPKFIVSFHSRGGSLYGGLNLGLLIRSYGFTTSIGETIPDGYGWHTTVKGICASACAFSFLGGVARWVHGGKYGVHQFHKAISLINPNKKIYNGRDLSSHQVTVGHLLEYVIMMGVEPRLVSIMTKALPEEMLWLGEDDLRTLKVDTSFYDTSPWTIEPFQCGIIGMVSNIQNAYGRAIKVILYSTINGPTITIVLINSAPSEYLQNMADAVHTISLDLDDRKMELDVKQCKIFINEEGINFRFNLNIQQITNISQNANNGIGINFNVPRVYWNSMNGTVSGSRLNDIVPLVLNNPIVFFNE